MPRRKSPNEFVFHLETYTVDTMPMNKLAAYLSDLATAFGEHRSVHLEQIEKGSVAVRVSVDGDAAGAVRDRLRKAKKNEGPPEARTAVHNINQRLAEDGASARLVDHRNRNILQFPAANRSEKIGPVRQLGTLDGVPIRVGGKGSKVPVHLDRFGQEIYMCEAQRQVARDIAHHLFGPGIRVHGVGTWSRWDDGRWEMDSFLIQDFTLLAETELDKTVLRLQAIKLPSCTDEDLTAALARIRDGS